MRPDLSRPEFRLVIFKCRLGTRRWSHEAGAIQSRGPESRPHRLLSFHARLALLAGSTHISSFLSFASRAAAAYRCSSFDWTHAVMGACPDVICTRTG